MGQFGYNHGDLGWTELYATDPAKALDFYADLIGYEKKPGPMPDYFVFGRGEEMLGGITRVRQEGSDPWWMPYITVADVDATLAKAKTLGATVIMEPTNMPGDCGRMAIFKDPQGACCGLAQYVKKD